MRLRLALIALCAASAAMPARADETLHAPSLPPLPPRWRLRASLSEGVGGGADGGHAVTLFPTTLEVGLRVWKPLSLTVAADAVLAGEEYQACGHTRRPNAVLGTAGVRVDWANEHGDSWLDPFFEVHAGVGRQGPPREQNGVCDGVQVFASAGAKLGLDVWLGRVAVTVAATWDWLPTAAPASIALGATVKLY